MPHKIFFRKILIIAAVAFGLIFLNNYFLGNFFQGLFYKIVNRPGQFLTDKLRGIYKFGQGFLKTKEIVANDDRLKEENQVLLGQVAELEGLKRENQFLRSELGVSQKINSKLLLVKIINIQKSPLASTILIDKGQKDGVKKSMAVITAGNILVGVVDQVFDGTSRILAIDDPRVKINARVQEANILVSTRGDLEGNLRLDLVTNQEKVKEGDLIVTNGLDNMPEFLPVAKITSVASSSDNLFQKVEAKVIFDSSLGSNLFVILGQ